MLQYDYFVLIDRRYFHAVEYNHTFHVGAPGKDDLMITHFAHYELTTVSLEGVKQVYGDRLGFVVVERTEERISFRVSSLTILSFREVFAPLNPAHFAFTVPWSKFQDAAEHVRASGLLVARWPDGAEISPVGGKGSLSMYFRDGDGNVLEIITYEHIPEHVLPTTGPLHVMYLREVGFPVQHVGRLRAWLGDNLRMTGAYGGDNFDFVHSGTAYTVTVSTSRPWIPIGMRALPPDMRVVFGTPERSFIEEAADKIAADGRLLSQTEEEILFRYDNYILGLRHTSTVPPTLLDPKIEW